MSSKQRVFSHNNSCDYIDYLRIKKGETILKNIKINHQKNPTPNIRLDRFISYNDFLNITKAYYKYKNNDLCNYHLLTDIYNTNKSFITHQKVIEHVNTCNYCYENVYPSISMDKLTCKQLFNILYPYGVYTNNCESNIYFPNHIDLNNWCNKKKIHTFSRAVNS